MAQNLRTVTVFRRRRRQSSLHVIDPCSIHPIHFRVNAAVKTIIPDQQALGI